jgi:methylated-DNA-[protein]-cysteine S-methyltransferase
MNADPSKASCYAAWPTAWGAMGGAWGDRGLIRLVLPHYSPADLDQILAWEHPGAKKDDKPFARLIELCRAYFAGGAADFAEIPCAMPEAASLSGTVLAACRKIPYGRTRSYSSLAEEIGSPDAARAVAAALGRNRIPLVVPCHRVLYADGRLGGFSAPGGAELKQRMLDLERRGPAVAGGR